ncbi:MAG TPA: hypothetical protein VMS17_27345 [Gemmataceae bacterium]|nr:hypothetical protein [Gemmataceae bacterium]
MTQFEEDYRTLKPGQGVIDPGRPLAPPRLTPPPEPKRLAPIAPPAVRPPAATNRLAALPARPLCRLFPLSQEASRLLAEEQMLLAYLGRLMSEGLFVDAVLLLAHALSPRDGVRWACECARSTARSTAGQAALAKAEAWLNRPNEQSRRACGEAATGTATAAGSVALAVFHSGAAPVDRPAGSSNAQLPARAVANAVILAAMSEPGRSRERYLRYLKDGIALAAGR